MFFADPGFHAVGKSGPGGEVAFGVFGFDKVAPASGFDGGGGGGAGVVAGAGGPLAGAGDFGEEVIQKGG